MKSNKQVIAELKLEQNELADKFTKLYAFINSVVPDSPYSKLSLQQQNLLAIQGNIQNAYINVLQSRIDDLEAISDESNN